MRRRGRHRAGDGDGVELSCGNREIESVDVEGFVRAVAPGAEESADFARVSGGAVRIEYFEGRAGFRGGRHQVGAEGRLARFVADLTDANIGRLRSGER